MKIFRSIQLGNAGPMSNSGPGCQQCVHFQNDPALIEEVYPGLTAMSSGFASVRDRDGFCNYHQLYLSARDNCPQFAAGIAGVAGTAGTAGL
jgi:hypothetical protein